MPPRTAGARLRRSGRPSLESVRRGTARRLPRPPGRTTVRRFDGSTVRRFDGSTAMLPLAQPGVRDVPGLPAPAGADLLQVLWCHFDHPPLGPMPRTNCSGGPRPRSPASSSRPRNRPWFSSITTCPSVPLVPEQITEYPHPMKLSEELRDPLGEWSRWQIAGAAADHSYASCPEDFHRDTLSVAPGWKAGGLGLLGLHRPRPPALPGLRRRDGSAAEQARRSLLHHGKLLRVHRGRRLGHPHSIRSRIHASKRVKVCSCIP
jgi:hypothetical protein